MHTRTLHKNAASTLRMRESSRRHSQCHGEWEVFEKFRLNLLIKWKQYPTYPHLLNMAGTGGRIRVVIFNNTFTSVLHVAIHTYSIYVQQIHTCTYMYQQRYIHSTYIHTYIRTYIHRYIHRYIQYVCKIETEIHMQYIHTQYIRTNIRTYIHTYVHWYIHRYIQYACKIRTYTRYMAQVVFVCSLSLTGKPGGSFTSTNCLNLWKCL